MRLCQPMSCDSEQARSCLTDLATSTSSGYVLRHLRAEKLCSDVEILVFFKWTELVLHTAKLNTGNPTDSSGTQIIN